MEPSPPLSPAQRSAIRRIAGAPPDDAAGQAELNVVPLLDILTNVLLFVIATIPAVFTATLPASAPELPQVVTGPRDPERAFGLTILVTGDGVDVKAAGGNVAPGCDGVGAGMTVPKEGDQIPWDKLRICATRLRQASEEMADRGRVNVIADPGVDLSTVVSAMDAVRETDSGEPLFPEVTFGVPR